MLRFEKGIITLDNYSVGRLSYFHFTKSAEENSELLGENLFSMSTVSQSKH